MKKIISGLLIILVLVNFIFCNNVYATDADFEGLDSVTGDSMSAEDQYNLVNQGSGNGIEIVWDILGAIFGAIAGILAIVINIFPMLMQAIMSILAGTENGIFTIENTVFNQYDIFNINFFDFTNTESDIVNQFRLSIAKYFVLTKSFAIIIVLVILIYVGIRMALSTVSSDKAKYKSMLIAWVESVAVLFLMQYIISFILNVGEMFSTIIYDIKAAVDATGDMSFEEITLNTIYSHMCITAGWTYVAYSIVFWFLVFIQSKFLVSYFKRLITVGFLILIAPLVTVTYAIDKIGDGKAQAFSVWLTELTMNVLIQPIHAIIYLVFMYTAGEIAQYSILVAAFFLLSLTKVEKIILYLFNLKNVVSLRPVDEERKKKF